MTKILQTPFIIHCEPRTYKMQELQKLTLLFNPWSAGSNGLIIKYLPPPLGFRPGVNRCIIM